LNRRFDKPIDFCKVEKFCIEKWRFCDENKGKKKKKTVLNMILKEESKKNISNKIEYFEN